MSQDDLCFTPATELRALITTKQLSPVELINALLNRIEQVNPGVNAFVTVNAEQALEAAKHAEQAITSGERELGPLHGLPVVVKDLTPTAGVRTTFGSTRFADHVPEEDGLIWARLKAAGAILLGKTTTPEFGLRAVTESELTGITNNPWDLTRTVGGSSGGSGAALAAGMAQLATGSDGGGSIRVPASYCGAVGLKASRGRIPIYTEGNAFETVDVVGPMTRTVSDNAMMLSVVAGPHPYDPYSLLDAGVDYLAAIANSNAEGLRIAYCPDLGNPPIEAAVTEQLDQVARTFEALGAIVEPVEMHLPDPIEYFKKWWAPYIGLAVVDALGDDTTSGTSPRSLDMLKIANEMTSIEHIRVALHDRERIHRVFADILLHHDVLLTATTPSVAPPHYKGPEGGQPIVAGKRVSEPAIDNQRCTEAVSHAGYPALSVPAGFSAEGLPVGLQVIAGHGQDALVLRCAKALEDARPWTSRRPTLPAK
jgi:Asp-tRNA(Asn)/Glu-tRNA(Gln) amidotransferase A subunit family amidase